MQTESSCGLGVDSHRVRSDGGDDRIRTCEGLLTLNGLANRRLQPLGHISATMPKSYSKTRCWIVKEGLAQFLSERLQAGSPIVPTAIVALASCNWPR